MQEPWVDPVFIFVFLVLPGAVLGQADGGRDGSSRLKVTLSISLFLRTNSGPLIPGKPRPSFRVLYYAIGVQARKAFCSLLCP